MVSAATPLARAEFKRLVNQFIMPLVAGTRLAGCAGTCPVFTEADRPSSLRLTLGPGAKGAPSLLLSRPQFFSPEEVGLVNSILAKWAEAFGAYGLDASYRNAIAARCKLVAIAEFVDPGCSALLLDILETMVDWAGQSYEGRRIAFSVGVDAAEGFGKSPASFREAVLGDYLKVMTNAHDTLLVCEPRGGIVRHESLAEQDSDGQCGDGDDAGNLYAPIMYAPIARWAAGKRYAAVLNPEGEILLFRDGSLIFAHRRGKWLFFTHAAYVAGIAGKGVHMRTAEALYQTMLDVSFARTGACLGLWRGERHRESQVIAHADRLDTPGYPGLSHKNRFLRRVIDGRPFQDLHRKLRLELASIDGATVMLADGELLAVGAILKIDGGSAGGGRAAAAMELAKRGVGAKVSNDGEIGYWTAGRMRQKGLPPPTYAIG